jgi:ribose transport system ATP-binding protein
MIYQEFNLIPDLTVAENIYLSREPRRFYNLLIDDAKMNRETQALLDSLNLQIKPTSKIYDLSVAEKQMVEIAKALVEKSDILILDEPTSALSENEVQKLFSIIRMLCKQGVAIIYISHRMEEMSEIADRVTVMRDGRHIETANWADVTIPKLISLMVGRSITDQYPERNVAPGGVVFEANGMTNQKLKNVSLQVRSGEVLGIAGLMGAGRTEFVRAIFGADRIQAGQLIKNGSPIRVKNPVDAVRHKLAYLPEDRKKDGLMLDLEVDTNILAASLSSYATWGVINEKKCAKSWKKKSTPGH